MKRPHYVLSVCVESATGANVFVFLRRICLKIAHFCLEIRTMATEWSNEKVITFLEILQTEPCLWDPKLRSFKNRGAQNDAWRRIMEILPFQTTVEEMKKKKESLMGYYRTHLNKIKKSLKSGAGKDDVYTTNWFAFETMDIFLRGVYDSSRTLNTEVSNTISQTLCQ